METFIKTLLGLLVWAIFRGGDTDPEWYDDVGASEPAPIPVSRYEDDHDVSGLISED